MKTCPACGSRLIYDHGWDVLICPDCFWIDAERKVGIYKCFECGENKNSGETK